MQHCLLFWLYFVHDVYVPCVFEVCDILGMVELRWTSSDEMSDHVDMVTAEGKRESGHYGKMMCFL